MRSAFLEPLVGWIAATGIASAIGAALSFDTSTYCSNDPPADPGVTATDLANLLNFQDVALSQPAVLKFQQWFGSQYWYQICECATGSTPSEPTPSNPGQASGNPGLPTNSSSPCWNKSSGYQIGARISLGVGPVDDFAGSLLPAGASIPYNTGPGGNNVNVSAPAIVQGATNLHLSATVEQTVAVSQSLEVLWLGVDNTGTLVPGAAIELIFTGTSPGSTSISTIKTLPAGVTNWALYVLNEDTSAHTGTISVEFSCPSGTNIGGSCCAPDPLLQGLLSQILALCQAIYGNLPVRVPNYAASPAHTGLSGQGTLTLASTTIAVLVTITTLPAVYGEEAGTPPTYFDVGWVTPVTNEGPESGIRLTRATEVVPLPEATSSLDYTLPPGEVISVAELQAG